ETAWRQDIQVAYELFATKHVDRLSSRQILEAAFEAMRSLSRSTMATPQFSDVAEVVAEDLARFNAATDELLRERLAVATDEGPHAASEASGPNRPHCAT